MAHEVGIRELRQNLSLYLRRVADGERFTVTDHNRPVAALGPPPSEAAEETWEELLARLGAEPAKDPRGVEGLPPPSKPEPGAPTSEEILDQLREERLW